MKPQINEAVSNIDRYYKILKKASEKKFSGTSLLELKRFEELYSDDSKKALSAYFELFHGLILDAEFSAREKEGDFYKEYNGKIGFEVYLPNTERAKYFRCLGKMNEEEKIYKQGIPPLEKLINDYINSLGNNEAKKRRKLKQIENKVFIYDLRLLDPQIESWIFGLIHYDDNLNHFNEIIKSVEKINCLGIIFIDRSSVIFINKQLNDLTAIEIFDGYSALFVHIKSKEKLYCGYEYKA